MPLIKLVLIGYSVVQFCCPSFCRVLQQTCTVYDGVCIRKSYEFLKQFSFTATVLHNIPIIIIIVSNEISSFYCTLSDPVGVRSDRVASSLHDEHSSLFIKYHVNLLDLCKRTSFCTCTGVLCDRILTASTCFNAHPHR